VPRAGPGGAGQAGRRAVGAVAARVGQAPADVERSWFRRVIAGQDAPPIFYTPDALNDDFDGAAPEQALVDEAWARWREEVAVADEVTAATSLDATGTTRRGDEVSLRWVLTHMIEEYARHNGHADLLRERIDGQVGE
jgi:hypothetical protein